MAGYPPKKNTAFTFYVSLQERGEADVYKTSPTLAAGDVKVSKDGGAFSNIGTLPSEIGSTGVLKVDLTASEMNADVVIVLFRDAAGDEWKDHLVTIETGVENIDDVSNRIKYPDIVMKGAFSENYSDYSDLNGLWRADGMLNGRPVYRSQNITYTAATMEFLNYKSQNRWTIKIGSSVYYYSDQVSDPMLPENLKIWYGDLDNGARNPTLRFAIMEAISAGSSAIYKPIVVSGLSDPNADGIYEFYDMMSGFAAYKLPGTLYRCWGESGSWTIGDIPNETANYFDHIYATSESGKYYELPYLSDSWEIYGTPLPNVTVKLYIKETLDAIDAIDGGLDAAGIRNAVGLASANLDTQLSGIKTDTGNVDSRLTAARAGHLDKLNVAGTLANTNNADTFKADVSGLMTAAAYTAPNNADIATIKAKTDNLPASPAAVGSAMTLAANAVDASAVKVDAVTKIQNGLALEATLTAIKGAGWTDETLKEIKDAIDAVDVSGLAKPGDAMTLTVAYDHAKDDVLTPLGVTDGKVDAIKAKTDNLPATPVAKGDIPTADITAIKAKTDNLPNDTGTTLTNIANSIGSLNDISAGDVKDQINDALLVDKVPDSYSSLGAQPTIAQALLMIWEWLTEKSIVNKTLTVYKPDGSTAAMTFTLDDATNPSEIKRTA